ncbi:hypothetical protein PVAP13_1KG142810 [Panicum virgatum]|uniref:Uncharacterized protein n=1 Tax=Panicum virgatum TaxID=38727 RepID=A0A8T0X8F6_PANVG|nr:hypothetical protein PVAP13_1KG142810 [Panicum virgatum]
MVLLSWNNFLRPLLRFVVVRSNHGERLVRISLSPKLMSISLGQKEEEDRRNKEEDDCTRSSLQECWSLVLNLLAKSCLLSVCLCRLLFNFLHRFGIEIWSSLVREYFESALCNLMMYSALI